MGLSNSTVDTTGDSNGGDASEHQQCAVSDKNFRFLMGKVRNVGPAAQRLFNLGKLYLSPDNPEQIEKDKHDFQELFHPMHESAEASDAEVNKAFKLFQPLKKSKPLHHGQTYVQWKVAQDYQSSYLLCMHKRDIIYIQPIDEFPDFVKRFRFQRGMIQVGLFELVQGFAQVFFSGIDVMVLPHVQTEQLGWNVVSRYHQVTGQKQYLANDFYPRLQSLLPSNGICILGFVWTDLFPENYNFVLGEASPQYRSGIFSFGRFPPSTFDPENPQDLTEITGEVVWKLIKVVSHEVSHLFGLDHCEFFHCAMNESNSITEAMSQPLFLCPVCLRKLHQVCGFDVAERYRELLGFLKDVESQLPYEKFQGAIRWLEECLTFLHSSD
ncbi:archaemetzincin-2-like [Babylonia areolata]|uniref:archaemetzincin-2-like n=1 Tax=Babylonia areolata TaxID=304850 RepID=UPI003FD2E2B7